MRTSLTRHVDLIHTFDEFMKLELLARSAGFIQLIIIYSYISYSFMYRSCVTFTSR